MPQPMLSVCVPEGANPPQLVQKQNHYTVNMFVSMEGQRARNLYNHYCNYSMHALTVILELTCCSPRFNIAPALATTYTSVQNLSVCTEMLTPVMFRNPMLFGDQTPVLILTHCVGSGPMFKGYLFFGFRLSCLLLG